MTTPREDFVPAYRIRHRDGGASLAFLCPFCRAVHSHGDADSDARCITGRAAHCANRASRWFGRGYRLLVIGDVASASQLPRIASADIDRLNAATTSI